MEYKEKGGKRTTLRVRPLILEKKVTQPEKRNRNLTLKTKRTSSALDPQLPQRSNTLCLWMGSARIHRTKIQPRQRTAGRGLRKGFYITKEKKREHKHKTKLRGGRRLGVLEKRTYGRILSEGGPP